MEIWDGAGSEAFQGIVPRSTDETKNRGNKGST